MTISAGAARVDITPRVPCHLAGYGDRNKPHEGIHVPLSLRALYARDGDGAEIVLVSADIIWFGGVVAPQVRGALARDMGIPEANCFLVGTHTHSAPDDSNCEYLATVAAQACAAAALARDRARPVRMSLARGESRIGVNRRERRGGVVRLGRNVNGPVDRELIVLSVDDMDGGPVARIANFACHGVVLGQNSYQVSGDWPGLAALAVERRTDGAPFLFLNGGAGNVNPKIGPQNAFGPVAEIADEFVGDLVDILGRIGPLPEADSRVDGFVSTVELPGKNDSAGKESVPLFGLRIGGVRIVGFPGEIFSETTMAVKESAVGEALMVCGYVNESESGYVPVREAYPEGGYEVDVSRFGEGSEEIVRDGLKKLATKLA